MTRLGFVLQLQWVIQWEDVARWFFSTNNFEPTVRAPLVLNKRYPQQTLRPTPVDPVGVFLWDLHPRIPAVWGAQYCFTCWPLLGFATVRCLKKVKHILPHVKKPIFVEFFSRKQLVGFHLVVLASQYTHSANGPWKKKFELYFPY